MKPVRCEKHGIDFMIGCPSCHFEAMYESPKRANPPMLGVPMLTGEITTELAVMEMLSFVMRYMQENPNTVGLTKDQKNRIADWFVAKYRS